MKLMRRLGLKVLLRAILLSKCAFLSIMPLSLFASPAFGQEIRPSYKHPISFVTSSVSDDRVVIDKGIAAPGGDDNKVCSLQPFPGMQATVSVASLQIPAKAQKEYDKACADLKSSKPSGAQKHLSNATQIFPSYAAGWVMLGQLFDASHQAAQARDACSRASAADPKYIPAYLCLAEIAGYEQNWSDVLDFSGRALELDSATDPYAYFFSAIAYFNLNNLGEAETRALKAAEIDKTHNQPLIQYLLSQIYQAKNDMAAAATYAEQYRKLTTAANAPTNSGTAQTVAQPAH